MIDHDLLTAPIRHREIGIAAGKGKGVIFKRGEIVRHVLESEMVDALMEEIDKWEKEETERGGQRPTDERGRLRLPILSR